MLKSLYLWVVFVGVFSSNYRGPFPHCIRNWNRRSIPNKMDDGIFGARGQNLNRLTVFPAKFYIRISLIYQCKNRFTAFIVAVFLFGVAHVIRHNFQIFQDSEGFYSGGHGWYHGSEMINDGQRKRDRINRISGE